MTKLNNALQGNPVSNRLLNSSEDGYRLAWDATDGYWNAEPTYVDYTVNPTGFVTVFKEKIEPYMNITVENLSTVTTFNGTTISGLYPSTTIASGSNGVTFPLSSATIFVADTTGFPSSGTFFVESSNYVGDDGGITYTSITGGGTPSFNGCNGGISGGVLYTGQQVNVALNGLTSIDVVDTTGFLSTGTIYVSSPTPVVGGAEYTYTGKTGTSFTGLTPIFAQGATINGSLISPSITGFTSLEVADTTGFPASGTAYFNSNTGESFTYTGISGNTFTGTTISEAFPLTPGISVSNINLEFTHLAFPDGYEFLVNFNNLTIAEFQPLLYIATGEHASIVSASTTVTSFSNGDPVILPVINVVSTAGFNPNGGTLSIEIIGGPSIVAYAGLTATTFTGCTFEFGSFGVNLSTGDVVTVYQSNAFVTGITDANNPNAEQILLSNTNGGGSDTSYTNNNYGSSTESVIFTSGTIPDPNNGNIVWILNTGDFGIPAPVNSDSQYANLYTCDGVHFNAVQTPISIPQYEEQDYTVSDGFNYGVPSNGNLTSVTLVAGSLTGDFDAAIPGPEPFMQTISNTTSFTATVGYSHDGSTFTGNTITISPNTESFVAGDETNVFAPGAPSTAPIPSVLINTGYTIVSDPSGTTYLVEAAFNPNIVLPDAPVDGTYYIFKDQNYSFSPNSQLTVQTQGSDEIEWGGAGNTLTTANFTNPGLSFTLEYFDTDAVWRVINKTDNELAPITVFSSGGTFFATDFRQVDYYIDTSSEVPAVFEVYDTSYTPLDGQEFSLKDPLQTWQLANVTLNFNNILEYPAGTQNSGSVTINTNGQYVRWRFNPQTAIWQLIASSPDFYSGATRPTTATIGFMFFDTTLDSGTGAGGQPIWWTGSVWVTADGNTA